MKRPFLNIVLTFVFVVASAGALYYYRYQYPIQKKLNRTYKIV